MNKFNIYFASFYLALSIGFMIPDSAISQDPLEYVNCPNNRCILVSGTCDHPLSTTAGVHCQGVDGNPTSGTAAACNATCPC